MILNDIALTIQADANTPLARIESFLGRRRLTLGYEPVAPKKKLTLLTLGACLAGRIPNRLAARYGEIDEICMAVTVVGKGRKFETKRVPRAATGPDLKKIVIGSDKIHGRITEAVLRVVPRPEAGQTFRLGWKNSASLARFIRALQGSGLRPLIEEKGALALNLRIEGPKEIVDAERETLMKLLRATGGKGVRP